MSMRAAMLTNETGPVQATLLAELTQGGTLSEVRTVRHGQGRAIPAALRLALYRPDLLITDGEGSGALVAALYRRLVRRSRLLVRLGDPARSAGFIRRLVLGQADGVLTDDVATGHKVDGLSQSRPIFPLDAPRGLEPYLACPLSRDGDAVYRLLYAGPLSPQSGVVDILLCVASWAERNPRRGIEIWWLGEGDLAGVLDAQPLPDNMGQHFTCALDAEAMAAVFAQCGIMILPLRDGPDASLVGEAMAAGLVVVGSQRDRQARRFLRDGVAGYTFDPWRADGVLEAIGRAMDSTPDDLAAMRGAGRDLVQVAALQGSADRLRHALAEIMPGATSLASLPAGVAAMDGR